MLIFISVIISAFFAFSLFHYLCKRKKPFKRAFVSLITGPLVLVILNILSSFTGVLVPLSGVSLMVSSTLGIPGVSLLVVLSALL